ncbi:MAG: type II secretion system protein GspD [Chlamydiia bacterium]
MIRHFGWLLLLAGCTSFNDTRMAETAVEAWYQLRLEDVAHTIAQHPCSTVSWQLTEHEGHLLVQAEEAPLLDLLQALLPDVEIQLPEEWGLQKVTAHLEEPSKEKLAEQIISLQGGSLVQSEKSWTVTAKEDLAGSETIVGRTLLLHHLPISTLQILLQGPQPTTGATTTPDQAPTAAGTLLGVSGSVQAGYGTESNQLFLRGPQREVSRLVQLIKSMDQEPVPIFIECVMAYGVDQDSITVNAQAALQTGQLQLNLAAVPFQTENTPPTQGVISLSVLDMLSPLTVFSPGTLAPGSVPANLIAYVNRLQGSVIAHPQVYCLGGSSASIYRGQVGYRFFTQSSGDSSTIGVNPITVGVTLTVTPILMQGGTVQATIDLKASKFVQDNPFLVANQLTTETRSTVQVRPGQVVHISGLRYPISQAATSGTAWARKVPVLKWLISGIDNQANIQDLDLFIVIRPQATGLGPMTSALSIPQRMFELSEGS